jgi:hypothetical protein
MEDQTTQPATEETKTATLGLQDLVMMAQIIQTATARASWKPEELSTVGALYDRLMSFLESSGAIRNTDQPVESDTTSGSEETGNA